MNSHKSSTTQFPDFFTTKGPLPLTVTPLKFGKRTYYQSSLVTENADNEPDRKPHLKPYMDNDEGMIDCGDMEDDYDIILNKTGKFQTSFYVPSSLLSFIIGVKGARLKSLQKSTNTEIKIPRINEKGDVIIIGDTERKVASARTQIAIIVEQRKQKMQPTHFVAIPIESDTIRENLLKFQETILQISPRGVTNSLFQKPQKVHLTLVVLTLLDDEELKLAKQTLESCYQQEILKVFEKNSRHNVTVQGLEIMNDDPSSAYVLYAKVHMQNAQLLSKLQDMCDKISNAFQRVGLAKKEYDRVKLHMTVMNTSFRNPNEERMPFDASEILEKHKDFYFGEFELKEIQICIRGTTTTESGEPKYYDTALRIPL
ncbi:activating signal cointegrator 1 complex subunit 1-like isoform X2 [Anthonomus grandis grandis]|nr:activating signal cointegrator 1 complex subunit 1-like isoform X2 [Anthonomus grandis grandis]